MMPATVRSFLRSQAAGGIVLMGAAALAMIVANGPLAGLYVAILHHPVGPLSVLHWIDDALMALFFLLVGLEIKRELLVGGLSRPADRVLPFIAAAGGMAVPALVYLAIAAGEPGLARGWAIPSATDIAFALGVMALLGPRVPASLRLFLATVAIVDDMGAVAVIALAYTRGLDPAALAAAAGVLAAMVALGRAGVARPWPYLLLAGPLWAAVWLSGIHATIAGVLAAAAIPLRPAAGGGPSPLHRLERGLHPWVAFGILPLFGFANAGVSLAGVGPATLIAPVPLGVAAGLFIGKQAGVAGAVWGATRLGLAPRPAGASWAQIHATALLCGIGFTMSLFIGGLAFADPARVDEVRVGVLAGSLMSATAGYAILRRAGRPPRPARP